VCVDGEGDWVEEGQDQSEGEGVDMCVWFRIRLIVLL
jgi:hypothetical protein